jgi:hypothetical protein
MRNGQQEFFKLIKSKIPTHAVLEQELAKVLKIDLLSAFALVRHQQTLSLEASLQLAQHFGISLNDLQADTPVQTPFHFIGFDYNVNNLEEYFVAILNEFNKVDLFGERKMVYVASELPLFSIFQFPELAAFKLFFWGKTVYNLSAFKNKRFDVNFLSDKLLEIGGNAWQQYLKFPSTEVWSSNIVNDIITQVYFFWKYRIFKTKRDALLICDKVIELLSHVEMQARIGKKFHPLGELPKKENYTLYYNDVSVSNNTILVETENRKLVFVSQNALNYLTTDNEIFFMQTQRWTRNLMEHSIKISEGNNKLRANFFQQMKGNIEFIKQEIRMDR